MTQLNSSIALFIVTIGLSLLNFYILRKLKKEGEGDNIQEEVIISNIPLTVALLGFVLSFLLMFLYIDHLGDAFSFLIKVFIYKIQGFSSDSANSIIIGESLKLAGKQLLFKGVFYILGISFSFNEKRIDKFYKFLLAL